jgi:KDO2-lipid IV(A) lauroyltransferase
LLDYIYLAIYNIFAFLVKNLPPFATDKIVSFLANLAYYLSKKRRDVIFANLGVCFKDMDDKRKKEIAIRSYKNLLYNIVSFLTVDKDSIVEKIRFENDKKALEAVKSGKKIIFFTAHFGVWELLPYAIIKHFKVSFSIVGRELDSKLMQKKLRELREKSGVELINKRGAMRGMIKALNRDRALGLLIDQSLPKSSGGVDVEFCGKKVTQTSAVSILAYKFDAIIIPIFIHSEDFKNHTVTCFDPITIDKTIPKEKDMDRLNQLQADITQEMIRRYPSEWFWSHKRFKVYNSEIYG